MFFSHGRERSCRGVGYNWPTDRLTSGVNTSLSIPQSISSSLSRCLCLSLSLSPLSHIADILQLSTTAGALTDQVLASLWPYRSSASFPACHDMSLQCTGPYSLGRIPPVAGSGSGRGGGNLQMQDHNLITILLLRISYQDMQTCKKPRKSL